MRIYFNKKKRGLTLVELMVSIAIFTIVLSIAYSIFGFSNKTYYNGVKQYDIQNSIRLANDYITQQIRYATKVKIEDSGAAIPDQSSLDTYDNYIYYEGNSIVHLSKYNKKTLLIGSGNINFESIDPFNDISFNITASSGSQNYNIKGEVYPLNLSLGTGKIEGTSSGTPAKISGSVIYFKTANNYISEELRPVASIGTYNEKTKLTIHFDRDIIGAEVVSSSGVTNLAITISTRDVTLTTSNTDDSANTVIRVTFGGLESYGNTYDYKAVYDGSSSWSLE